MADEAKIKEKIKYLLNLTEGKGATEAEAALALDKVNELLEKYNLTLESVGAVEGETNLVDGIISAFYNWEKILFTAIGRHNMCEVFLVDSRLHITGRSLNVFATSEMFRWISLQFRTLANEAKKDRAPGVSVNAWKNNFFGGATNRVCSRLREMREARHEAYSESDKNALVVINTEAEDFRKQLYGSDFRQSGIRLGHGHGYAAGVEAGDKVSLNREELGSRELIA